MTSTYELTNVDGDTETLTPEGLAEFFAINEGIDRAAIEALAIGETYSDGGGAQPEWSIRRVS